jgi:hypothetical protein
MKLQLHKLQKPTARSHSCGYVFGYVTAAFTSCYRTILTFSVVSIRRLDQFENARPHMNYWFKADGFRIVLYTHNVPKRQRQSGLSVEGQARCKG